MVWGYLLALGAGVSFVFQQAVNSNLRAELGSPWWAGFVSYLGGTIVMLAVALALREPAAWAAAASQGRWLSWSGGIFGAIYIAVSIFLSPRFGAATVIGLIVAGQMLGSLAFISSACSACRCTRSRPCARSARRCWWPVWC